MMQDFPHNEKDFLKGFLFPSHITHITISKGNQK